MKRRWLVPEVLQTSLMDCGPAALKALLQGFGVVAHYDLLRERCQTDVDGTSMDALAGLSAEFGVQGSQLLVPRDSFLLPEARCLPAIVATRSASGQLHFLVVWSRVGPFVQVMDPASGRRWQRCERFLEKMPDLPVRITARRFRRWAESPDAIAPLCAKLRALGVSEAQQRALLARARSDPSWLSFAALDAGVRMIGSLIHTRGLARGAAAASLLSDVFERAVVVEPAERDEIIPRRFWWVTSSQSDELLARGGVIVHFARPAELSASPRARAAPATAPRPELTGSRAELGPGLPPALGPLLTADAVKPLQVLWRLARFDAPGALWVAAGAHLAGACLMPIEAGLLRSLLDLSHFIVLDYQRIGGVVALLALLAAASACDWLAAAAVHRVGLGLELRLRVGFLRKLPLLDDRYLRSRTSSDVAARGHAMHVLRELPQAFAAAYRAACTLVAATVAIAWLWPAGALPAALAAVGGVAAPWLLRRSMVETGTRLRTHATALERFYLDALLGASPIHVHGAERAVRVEHESLLTEWTKTARSMSRQSTVSQAMQTLVSTALTVLLVYWYSSERPDAAGLLLLAYLASRIPSAAHELVQSQLGYLGLRSVVVRLLAPLGAAQAPQPIAPGARESAPVRPGVAIRMREVSSFAGGHALLREVSVDIPPGGHVAIVGASGAGKSSLLGLLLGFSRPSSGEVWIDGERADAARLTGLRDELVWVDPAVRLWDRSLYENVTFGDPQRPDGLPRAVHAAELIEVLESLPAGMQAGLGEGGVRLSAGQGQRVRLARGLMREQARLVLLDEPFRGLQREQRRLLLSRTREHFRGATLLWVSHDVSETLELDRVLVFEQGRIVEDGAPRQLLAREGGRYRALFEADRALRSEVWSPARWQHARLHAGAITQERRA